jgi:hypothetical protein
MKITITNSIKDRIPYFHKFKTDEIITIDDMPFLDEIVNNLKITNLNENNLIEMIKTLSYLGMSTKKAVDEFIWIIGEFENLFCKYFDTVHTHNLIKTYKLKNDIDVPLRDVILTYYSGIKSSIQLNVRFYKIDTRWISGEGNLRLLKYARNNNYSWESEIFIEAAWNGHLDCLKYAYEHGCEWHESTCEFAVLNGHIDCLKYARENGCPWGALTCTIAAENGQLECLKYLYGTDCPKDTLSCNDAAKNGHLECLKFLHEIGCKWDESTCADAASGGHLECLKYLHENGCPWDAKTCASAAGHNECLDYAYQNGCEWEDWTCANYAQWFL